MASLNLVILFKLIYVDKMFIHYHIFFNEMKSQYPIMQYNNTGVYSLGLYGKDRYVTCK